jgi:N-terminal domain of argonaute/Argonaute linker 1 domain
VPQSGISDLFVPAGTMSKHTKPSSKNPNWRKEKAEREARGAQGLSRVEKAAKPAAPQLTVSEPPANPPGVRTSEGIGLLANYFEIKLTDPRKGHLFQYSIAIQPVPATRRVRRRLIYCWLQQYPIQQNHASDYHGFLITDAKLFEHAQTRRVTYWDEDETQPRTNNPVHYDVTVTENKVHNISDFMQRLSSNPGDLNEADVVDCITTLNIVFSDRMNRGSFRTPNQEPTIAAVSADKFYSIENTHSLFKCFLKGTGRNARATLIAHKGFARSVRCSDQLLLNVNNATTAFYPQGSLTTLVTDWLTNLNVPIENINWPRHDLSIFLRGLRIQTTHLGPCKRRPERIYTISGLAQPINNQVAPNPGRIFFTENGNAQISVGAYFARGS